LSLLELGKDLLLFPERIIISLLQTCPFVNVADFLPCG
jgi:hypothetical protein